ncbi:MAG: Cystathionine gamma-synthase [Gemmatimonadaceae bacterium]|nr:Cystathionine gamma-synthase [Gemmatimonadaceae bacterium]
MRIETLCVHAGHGPDSATGAVSPPLYLSTTYERDTDGEFRRGFVYARDANPTRAMLERALAELEGGEAALAWSSGQAATNAVFQSLRPGDHVVVPVFAYYGTPQLVREVYEPWGLQASYVDMRTLDAVRNAVRDNTRLIWVESPSNPLLTLTDIAGVVEIARDVGARVAVDNTWATPLGQRPLELGADIVMHSTTKYLSGHSDVLSGALVVRERDDDLFPRLRLLQKEGGAIAAPFDAWLVARGIRTLPWRMRAHTANAMAVALFLQSHPAVEAVHYPGLVTHPQHEIARRQMHLYGGMASVQVRGGRSEALATAARLRVFTRATSLGAVESLIEHRASIEGSATRAPENLLRMSIGLEHHEDLIDDLQQALGG